MIIEYRVSGEPNQMNLTRSVTSTVKRTYKDVAYVKRDTGDTVHLFGRTPPQVNEHGDIVTWAGEFFIACIHLAPGEYLECVDVPRD